MDCPSRSPVRRRWWTRCEKTGVASKTTWISTRQKPSTRLVTWPANPHAEIKTQWTTSSSRDALSTTLPTATLMYFSCTHKHGVTESHYTNESAKNFLVENLNFCNFLIKAFILLNNKKFKLDDKFEKFFKLLFRKKLAGHFIAVVCMDLFSIIFDLLVYCLIKRSYNFPLYWFFFKI